MKTIVRKSMLYETGVEYGDWAMNHVEGCSHGCKYPCYAYLQKKRFGVVKVYEDWCEPKLVSNTLELLEKELTPRRVEKIKNVQMCFTTDPFMVGYPPIHQLSLCAVELINSFDIPVTILTKGYLPSLTTELWDEDKDEASLWIAPFGYSALEDAPAIYMVREDDYVNISELHKDNYYGISLVSLDEGFRKKWEPGSAPYADRIASLKALHDAGMKTWVSMEPYPAFLISGMSIAANGFYNPLKLIDGYHTDPDISKMITKEYTRSLNAIAELLLRISFVDRIVFGKWNYSKDTEIDAQFYKELVSLIKGFCEIHNIEYLIKEGAVR